MLEQLRIKGLRSLVDTGYIDISPITILLGKNSSGKSSFLRTLPLLKQSSLASTIGHILWYSPDMVDFGDFDTAVKSEDKSLSFSFRIKIPKEIKDFAYYARYIDHRNTSKKQEQSDIEVCITLKKKTNIPYVETIYFKNNDINIKIEFNDKGESDKILVNNQDFQKKIQKINYHLNSAFPIYLSIITKDNSNYYYRDDLMARNILESMRAEGLMPKRVNENYNGKFYEAFRSNLIKYSGKNLINSLKNSETKYISKFYTEQLSEEKNEILIRYSMLFKFDILLKYISLNMDNMIRGIKYIAPTRAFAERYYRLQNLSTDDLSPDGKNLPFMLYNISQNENDKKSLNEWLKATINVEFKIESQAGHIQILLKEKDSNDYLTMADMGFGYSQIIPILVSIWKEINKQNIYYLGSKYLLMVIEQPELHLHPKMQGDLANMFSKAVKAAKEKDIDLKFIIETHSDHMIRKFAKLIDNKDIESDMLNIVFFEKEQEKKETLTKQLKFGNDGFINGWPVGFFDIG